MTLNDKLTQIPHNLKQLNKTVRNKTIMYMKIREDIDFLN